jgi:hypothetical protein
MNEDDQTFDALLEEEFLWPTIGDKLFTRCRPAYDAFLARQPDERHYHLTQGYKLAADLLVERSYEAAWTRQKLVYPALFCYRHFIELILKKLLKEYGSLAEIRADWRHHKLEDLWRDFRAMLQKLNADDSEDSATEAVEHCIAEFSKIDPSSETFRYPVGRKGQLFDVGFDAVDLEQLHRTMESIEIYFMCVDGFLGNLEAPDFGI